MFSRIKFILTGRKQKTIKLHGGLLSTGTIYTRNVNVEGLRKGDFAYIIETSDAVGVKRPMKVKSGNLNIWIGEITKGNVQILYTVDPKCQTKGIGISNTKLTLEFIAVI